MTNRIDRELECSITYDGEAMWRRHRDRDVKGVDGQWTQSKSSAMRDPGSTTHGPNGGRKENMHKVVYSFSRNTVLTSHNDWHVVTKLNFRCIYLNTSNKKHRAPTSGPGPRWAGTLYPCPCFSASRCHCQRCKTAYAVRNVWVSMHPLEQGLCNGRASVRL